MCPPCPVSPRPSRWVSARRSSTVAGPAVGHLDSGASALTTAEVRLQDDRGVLARVAQRVVQPVAQGGDKYGLRHRSDRIRAGEAWLHPPPVFMVEPGEHVIHR